MERTVGVERRGDGRVAPPAGLEINATVRPGCAVTLANVSSAGALVWARRPLRPGGRVHLQVIAGVLRVAVAAQVVRCTVRSLDAVEGVVYAGALRFDQRVEWGWR